MFIISRLSKSGGQEYLVPARFSRYRWAKRAKARAKSFVKKETARDNARKYSGMYKLV